MQVDDNAARLLQVLTLLKQPRAAIEIGAYFGFSTLHIARGLPPGGKLTSYEINPANIAEKFQHPKGMMRMTKPEVQ